MATNKQKEQTVNQLKTSIFSTDNLSDYEQNFEKHFSQELLIEELLVFETLLAQEVKSSEDINNVINKQKEMLFTSYKNGKSLLFYYFYGTVNYANAVLTKLNNQSSPSTTNEAKEMWFKTIRKIQQTISYCRQDDFDTSGYCIYRRELRFLEKKCKAKKTTIVTDSSEFTKLAKLLIQSDYSWLKNVEILTLNEYLKLKFPTDYLIYYLKNNAPKIKGNINTVAVIRGPAKNELINNNTCQLLIPEMGNKQLIYNAYTIVSVAFRLCLSNHNSPIAFPKMDFYPKLELNTKDIEIPLKSYFSVHYSFYVCIYPKSYTVKNLEIAFNGSRGKIAEEKLNIHHLQYKSIDKDKFKEQFKFILKLLRL